MISLMLYVLCNSLLFAGGLFLGVVWFLGSMAVMGLGIGFLIGLVYATVSALIMKICRKGALQETLGNIGFFSGAATGALIPWLMVSMMGSGKMGHEGEILAEVICGIVSGLLGWVSMKLWGHRLNMIVGRSGGDC